jgi:hypothetical protein
VDGRGGGARAVCAVTTHTVRGVWKAASLFLVGGRCAGSRGGWRSGNDLRLGAPSVGGVVQERPRTFLRRFEH